MLNEKNQIFLYDLIKSCIIKNIGGLVLMQYIDFEEDSYAAGYEKIYLAGGCFWGIEAYFSRLPGIISAVSGYANGKTKDPYYEEVCKGTTGFAETVMIEYDPNIISLEEILNHYFDIVDPTTLNRQGADIGNQYRSGIYYLKNEDLKTITEKIKQEQKIYNKTIVTEVKKLENFYKAEEYHQKYLDKNPGGYCHIDLSKIKKYQKYKKPSKKELQKNLSELSYKVTQENFTEAPYSSEYDKNFEEGIYVDITTGEPLFSSKDKYDAGCGWPSFLRPIEESSIREKEDRSYGMTRIEVKSDAGNAHLGHLFNDGPTEKGGLRYCINGAALRFIPAKDLEKEGYGEYSELFRQH